MFCNSSMSATRRVSTSPLRYVSRRAGASARRVSYGYLHLSASIDETAIWPITLAQYGTLTNFDKTPVLQYGDLFGMGDGVIPVGNHQHRSITHQALQGLSNEHLAFGIKT